MYRYLLQLDNVSTPGKTKTQSPRVADEDAKRFDGSHHEQMSCVRNRCVSSQLDGRIKGIPTKREGSRYAIRVEKEWNRSPPAVTSISSTDKPIKDY